MLRILDVIYESVKKIKCFWVKGKKKNWSVPYWCRQEEQLEIYRQTTLEVIRTRLASIREHQWGSSWKWSWGWWWWVEEYVDWLLRRMQKKKSKWLRFWAWILNLDRSNLNCRRRTWMDGYSVGMLSKLFKYVSETLEPETGIHVKKSTSWILSSN